MYAQITTIRVPLDQMGQMRHVIQHDYLPKVSQRTGYLFGYLMEQVDDPEYAELVIFWSSQADVENFNRTGLLEASVASLAAHLPGVRVVRQGYIVSVAAKPTTAGIEDTQPTPAHTA